MVRKEYDVRYPYRAKGGRGWMCYTVAFCHCVAYCVLLDYKPLGCWKTDPMTHEGRYEG